MRFLICLALILSLSCTRREPDSKTARQIDDANHTLNDGPRNSLEYIGRYHGKLPCESCEGISATIQLSEGFNYIFRQTHIENETSAVERKGKFAWSKDGTSIILDNSEMNTFVVGERTLSYTNPGIAQPIVFEKVTESSAAKSDSKNSDNALTEIHWTMTELKGKAVRKTGRADFFIEFSSDNHFRAFAGCNSIGGKYVTAESKLRFGETIATEMACAEMLPEQQFLAMLDKVDNFIRNDKILMIRRGNTIVAKFEAMPEKLKP